MNWRPFALGLFVLAIGLAPLLLPNYQITLMNYIGLAALVALGLVLLTGIGGLTSFGQAAFVGIGAYVTAYLTTLHGLSPWIGLFAGFLVSGLAAALIGAVTLRLSGHFLPLSTIAWSISLYFLAGNIQALGAHDGITGVPPIAIFGHELRDTREYCYLIWICVLLGLLSVANLLNSRTGRAIRCLRGRIVMAEAFGIHTVRLKLLIFIHAALLASLSGWLYAHLLLFVNPTPFGVGAGIEYLFMAVVGGAASIWGAVVGAGVLTILRDVLEDVLPRLFGTSGALESIAFGLLMVVVLQRARAGIVPLILRFLPPAPPPGVPAKAPPLAPRRRTAGEGSLLVLENVTRRFGGLVAVNCASFELRQGEILGLIGPNGAGKSTLFNLITGVLRADAGKISLRGAPIGGLAARDIARLGIARTFQHVQLRGDMSALENVAIGAHLRSRRGALASILRFDRQEEAGLLAEARRQIERVGLAAHVHDRAGSLALGQQRILEIARALAADPDLLLLDEPAAGLRYHEKKALGGVLAQLRAQGMSILVVEHDMDFVMNLVDRLVVMDFGQKIAEGLPADVQANRAVQEAYLGVAA
jgi:ABC-type branched-subunit amino acid transport system ATPase component/ABC-type branched-subunit amino acid transport system permease subunit